MDSEFGYGTGPELSLGIIPWRNGKVFFPFSQFSAQVFKGGGGVGWGKIHVTSINCRQMFLLF